MNSICSVHIISRLDSQNKFHMFALFSGRHVGVPRRWWWLRSWLCRFMQNISTNISSLGKRTDVNLRKVSSLSVSYNIKIP